MSILLLFDAGPIPSGSYAITDHANTSVVHIGSGVHTITKSANDGSFNASAVSSVGLTGDFVLRVKALDIPGGIFVGMNSDPLTDDSYTSIDFAWRNPLTTISEIWESNTQILTGIPSGTYFWIWRVGTTLGYGRGNDLATAQASPDRTTTSSATLYFDSSFLAIGDKVEVLLSDLVATTVYSLTADAGVFSLTGQSVNLLRGYSMAAAAGVFTYTGQAVNLLRGYEFVAGQATFTYSGQAAALTAAYKMAAAVGVFSYAGQSVNLPRGYNLAAAPGSFTYSGQLVNLTLGGVLAAATGTFTYSGQAAALIAHTSIAAAPGVFNYAGQDVRVTLNLAYLPAGSGGGTGVKVVATLI